jgi:hypothetical protein
MGLRNWIFEGQEEAADEAARLRDEAKERPDRADVTRLVEIYHEAYSAETVRRAVDGLEFVAGHHPDRLSGVMGDIIDGTTVYEGHAKDFRRDLAEVVESAAEIRSGLIRGQESRIVSALESEFALERATSKYPAALDQQKVRALCRALVQSKTDDARDALETIRHEAPPDVRMYVWTAIDDLDADAV